CRPQVPAHDSSGGFDHHSPDRLVYGLGQTPAAQGGGQVSLRLDLQSFLPRFALVDTARHNDNKRARELCAGIKAGEIVIFDKAYVDYSHLADLMRREVFWVTRAKDNMSFRVERRKQKKPTGKILRDDLIRLKTPAS